MISNIYRNNQFTWSCNHEQNLTWTEARDRTVASGGSGQNTSIRAEVYHGTGSNSYDIYRSGASYDTSGIPANATIHSAILRQYRRRERTGQYYGRMEIQKMTDIGVATSFYNKAYFTDLVGEYYSSLGNEQEADINAYLDVTLAVGAITKAGWTYLGFRTYHDYANYTPPRDNDSTSMNASDWSGTQSYLIITWTTPPAVTSGSATNKGLTTVTLAGNVTDAGSGTVAERGIVYGLDENPTTANGKKMVAGTTGAYTGDITGLSSSTLYHYRAYVITENSTQYGADATFTTLPACETSAMTNLGVGSATANGNVTSVGEAITERGFVWNTATAPTTSHNKVVVAGTTGAMASFITAMPIGRRVYLRSFVTNETATVYGNEINFIMVGGVAVFNCL